MNSNKHYMRTMVKYVGNIQRLFDAYDQSIEDQLVPMLEDFICETNAARTKDSLADKKARGERVGATDEVLERARKNADVSRRLIAKENNPPKLKVIEAAVLHIRRNRGKVGCTSIARLLNGPVLRHIQNEENTPSGIWHPYTITQVIKHHLNNDYGLDVIKTLVCLEDWEEQNKIRFLQ
jgi:hypothetical protein